jgi:hypothetical protein
MPIQSPIFAPTIALALWSLLMLALNAARVTAAAATRPVEPSLISYTH